MRVSALCLFTLSTLCGIFKRLDYISHVRRIEYTDLIYIYIYIACEKNDHEIYDKMLLLIWHECDIIHFAKFVIISRFEESRSSAYN